MRCKRDGCPNLIKGEKVLASVLDERRLKQDHLYKGPHEEWWCLECYQALEGHKYTYVIKLPPGRQTKITTQRIPRKLKDGETADSIHKEVPLAAKSPVVDKKIPVGMATQPAFSPPKRGPGRPRGSANRNKSRAS